MRVIGIAIALTCIATAQNSASVEGRVIDGASGLGIPDASVLFRFAGQEYRAVTDPSGGFRVFGMADGQYGARVEKEGYVPLDSATENSPLTIVSVNGSGPAAQIRAVLVRYARVSGRVFDKEGSPVAGVSVTYANAPGSLPPGRPTEQFTDARGEFAFAKLVPGSYVLRAVPPSGAGAATASDVDRIEAVPTWYPAVDEGNLAERIAVRSGADLRGIDIRLQSTPVYRVRGVVLGQDGQPVRAAVSNQSETDRTTTFGIAPPSRAGPLGFFAMVYGIRQSILTMADGSFEFDSVPRGLRRFSAQLSPFNRVGSPVVQTAVVSVAVDHNIDNLEIRLLAPVTIEGSIELAGLQVDKMRTIRTGIDIFSGVGGIRPTSNSVGGSFRIENIPPGEASIVTAPGLAGGYYLDSVSLGGRDVTWKSFTLQPGAAPVRIVYKPNAGTVTGTVESPEADDVVLIPQPALDSLDVQYGRISRRTPTGTFEIDSVGPGSYYAFAVDRLEPDKLSNPAAVRRIVNAAALIQVTEGAAISIKPPLVRFSD